MASPPKKTLKAAPEPSIARTIKGEIFGHRLNPHMARFWVKFPREILSRGIIETVPDVLPADYEPDRYDVSGEVVIKIVAKPKPKG